MDVRILKSFFSDWFYQLINVSMGRVTYETK